MTCASPLALLAGTASAGPIGHRERRLPIQAALYLLCPQPHRREHALHRVCRVQVLYTRPISPSSRLFITCRKNKGSFLALNQGLNASQRAGNLPEDRLQVFRQGSHY